VHHVHLLACLATATRVTFNPFVAFRAPGTMSAARSAASSSAGVCASKAGMAFAFETALDVTRFKPIETPATILVVFLINALPSNAVGT